MSTYDELSKLENKSSTSRKPSKKVNKTASIDTRVTTQEREKSRDNTSDGTRRMLRDLPTRDEIQGFSFRLRDELKVKVQAEVPHKWQKELEEVARRLNVKKLELYRFIIGEFLGKVKRKEAG